MADAKRTVIRFLLFGVLGIMLLVAGAVYFLTKHRPKPLGLSCAGTPKQMGKRHGEQLGTPIKMLLRFYIRAVVCRGDEELLAARQNRAVMILDDMDQCYADELRAVATASNCELNTLCYANCFLDMGSWQAGCRSAVTVKDNRLLHAHNLDWDNLGGLAKYTTAVIWRRPEDGRHPTVTVGFPGMIGALDIINDRGIALSFNQLGLGRAVPEEPIFVTMRRIAENCASFEAAHQQVMQCAPGVPFIITLSSATEGKAAVHERQRDEITVREMQNGWVAACNVAQGTERGQTLLDQQMANTEISGTDDLIPVLRHPEVMMASNIYSLIFDFSNNRLLLASGSIPAAQDEYREFELFAK